MTFNDLIVIAHWKWNVDFEENKLISPDRNLKSVIDNWRRELRSSSDEEIFEQKRNLIVTSNGWYGALFGDTVKEYFDVNKDIVYHYPRYKSH